MDLILYLTELLEKTSPGAVAWIGGAAIGTKFGVDAIKRFRPNLQGNVIQSVTAGVAVVATLLQAATVGVFDNGLDAVEFRGLLIVSLITWLGAIGVNEVLKNRNEGAEAQP